MCYVLQGILSDFIALANGMDYQSSFPVYNRLLHLLDLFLFVYAQRMRRMRPTCSIPCLECNKCNIKQLLGKYKGAASTFSIRLFIFLKSNKHSFIDNPDWIRYKKVHLNSF